MKMFWEQIIMFISHQCKLLINDDNHPKLTDVGNEFLLIKLYDRDEIVSDNEE